MLHIGQQAPLFEAESTQGPVRLQDWVGRRPVVLLFYPKDETPVCTSQLCAVRDNKARYEALGAVVVGINPGTPDEHRAFAANHGFDFPIVADPDERIRKLYGVGKILGLFLQQRIVYVIDRRGTIVYARKGNRPTEEILAALQKAEGRR